MQQMAGKLQKTHHASQAIHVFLHGQQTHRPHSRTHWGVNEGVLIEAASRCVLDVRVYVCVCV